MSESGCALLSGEAHCPNPENTSGSRDGRDGQGWTGSAAAEGGSSSRIPPTGAGGPLGADPSVLPPDQLREVD